MLFEIDTVGDVYSYMDACKLELLGFMFTKDDLIRVKTKSGTPVNFTTLEELMSFARSWSSTGNVIIDTKRPALIIFDDFSTQSRS